MSLPGGMRRNKDGIPTIKIGAETTNPEIAGFVVLPPCFRKRRNNDFIVVDFNYRAMICFKSGQFKPSPGEFKPRIKRQVFTVLVRALLKVTCLISSGHFNLGERPWLLQLNNAAA
ncbi:hypothetical protein [Paraburkholderia bonniea]|uniref:hypothetical protein n=1 Tax=Paraburkholderia bonniea TaxID=2152891 RepID=UPI001580A1D3|nr:hypothetical protein [Paraburkholderia bonniea]